MSETAPKSLSTYSATSSPPAVAAGQTRRSVTPSSTCSRPCPSERATSSSPPSPPRSDAATGSSTYGKLTSVSTRKAPGKPARSGHSEIQVNPATYDGTARGSTSSTAQARRPGRSARTTSQAPKVPSTMHAPVTAPASATLRTNSSAVRGRATISANTAGPGSSARTAR